MTNSKYEELKLWLLDLQKAQEGSLSVWDNKEDEVWNKVDENGDSSV